MIKFIRFMQVFCVVFGTYDFAVAVWRAVDARWGWMVFQMACAGWMAALWRINGRQIERIESARLEQELWQ